jgi:hypothetical protein
MKTIEEFTLKNMIVIEKYLNNELSENEKAQFLNQLDKDEELREDFDLAKASLKDIHFKKGSPSVSQQKRILDYPVFSISKKKSLGKKITKDGLLYITIATLMLAICIIILYIIA